MTQTVADNKISLEECIKKLKPLYPELEKRTISFWLEEGIIPRGEWTGEKGEKGSRCYYDLKEFGEHIGYLFFLKEILGFDNATIKEIVTHKKGEQLTLPRSTADLTFIAQDFHYLRLMLEKDYKGKLDPYSILWASRRLFARKVKENLSGKRFDAVVDSFMQGLIALK